MKVYLIEFYFRLKNEKQCNDGRLLTENLPAWVFLMFQENIVRIVESCVMVTFTNAGLDYE